jgi:hypothetical protein
MKKPLGELQAPARSIRACKYLNLGYRLLGNHLGYERAEISNLCLSYYYGHSHGYDANGEWWPVPARTTTTGYAGEVDILSPSAFAEYVEFVLRFATRFGVVIPDPRKPL